MTIDQQALLGPRRLLLTAADNTEAHPRLAVAIGAAAVSATSIFIALASQAPGTASFYRCALALPLLFAIAVRERRRTRRISRHELFVATAAGVLFAGDMLLWTQAIYDVGAGVSTVLVNVQVVFVPLLALAIDREPISRRFLAALPFAAIGVVLAGGLLDHRVAGTHLVRGTIYAVLAALCYSGFLFILRRSGRTAPVVQSYTAVTAVTAVASCAGGLAWNGFSAAPRLGALGWLALAGICGQVIGWLLVARGSPHLDSQVSSVLLLLTPVGSLMLGALVLAQVPTLLQLVGSLLVLACASFVARQQHAGGVRLAEGERPPRSTPS